MTERKICENCGTRPGDCLWVGDGGTLAVAHGLGAWWCNRCIVEAQLKYANERAADIPRLERKLAELMAVQP